MKQIYAYYIWRQFENSLHILLKIVGSHCILKLLLTEPRIEVKTGTIKKN